MYLIAVVYLFRLADSALNGVPIRNDISNKIIDQAISYFNYNSPTSITLITVI